LFAPAIHRKLKGTRDSEGEPVDEKAPLEELKQKALSFRNARNRKQFRDRKNLSAFLVEWLYEDPGIEFMCMSSLTGGHRNMDRRPIGAVESEWWKIKGDSETSRQNQ